MEPVHALIELDPSRVVTPLRVDAIEEALSSRGLLKRWCHVVKGIRFGFDMGIRGWWISTALQVLDLSGSG
jgi:hypothetical protein